MKIGDYDAWSAPFAIAVNFAILPLRRLQFALLLPILRVLVKMNLHTKNQPDLSTNVARAEVLGYLVPTSAPNLP